MFNQMGGAGRGLLGKVQPPASNPYGVYAGSQALKFGAADKGIPTTASFAQGMGLPGPGANGVNPLVPTGSYGMSETDQGMLNYGMQMMQNSQPQFAQMQAAPQQDIYANRGRYAGLDPLGLQQRPAMQNYRGRY